MEFKKGDEVMVKVTGTRVPVPGKLISNRRGEYYTVKLLSGDEKSINEKNIQLVDDIDVDEIPVPKSPARGRGRPRKSSYLETEVKELKSPSPKSPGRKAPRSPARSPSRRSPSRRSPSRQSPSRRSPARRSPARKPKSPTSPLSRKILNQAGITKMITIPLEKLNFEEEPTIRSSPSPVPFLRSRKPVESIVDKTTYIKSTEIINYSSGHTLDTLKHMEPSRLMYLSEQNNVDVPKEKYSDDEEEIDQKLAINERASLPRVIPKSYDLYKNIVALIITVGSLLTFFFLNVACNARSCSYTEPIDFKPYKKLSTYFSKDAFIIYGAYLGIVALLNMIPIGGSRVPSQPSRYKKADLYLNGMFITVVVFTILGALDWYGFEIFQFITDKYFQLGVTAVVYAFILSTIAFIRSFFVPYSYLNLSTANNRFIYGFFMGREVNPGIYKFYPKIWVFYSGFIGIMVMFVSFIINSLRLATHGAPLTLDNVNIDPTLLTAAGIYLFYTSHYIITDRTYVCTFDMQHECFGFNYICSLGMWAFVHTLVAKYIFEHGVELELWRLAAVSVVFLVFSIIMWKANNQKNTYRMNPFHASVAHLETIPTPHGKKLLVSGYWGFVRHPNYTADGIAHLAYAMLAPTVPATFGIYVSLIYLIHRSHRDGKRCQQRYGPAWERYCQRVPYALIPKIY